MKENLKIFIISSSLPIFIITLSYLGFAYKNAGRPKDIPIETFGIIVPLFFGIFGILNYYIIKRYGINYSLFVGLLLGITFSLMGRFGLGLPQKIFNYNKNNEYQVHIIASILYSLIFRFIVTPLQLYLN